jgi:pyrroloquinoline-quinone synthase
VTSLRSRLDRATTPARLLDHPFYKAWSAGTLTRADLGYYATQYWRQVEAFPDYLERVAERLPAGEAKRSVLANLADERDDDHPGLWLDFAAALGLDKEQVTGAAVETETARCIEEFAAAMTDASPAFALGMLYGYESQTPAVAETKVTGLRDHYGIDGAGVTYFELHGELDVAHSAEMASAIEEIADDPNASADAEAGAAAGARAIWGLLDGVTRARAIC